MGRYLMLLVVFGTACNKQNDNPQKLPPADNWQNAQKPAAAEPAAVPPGGNPHGAMNPHGGMAGGDPHAGMDMGGADPHAGMNMNAADPAMAGMQAPDPNRPVDASKFLKGTLEISKENAAFAKPGAVIFLSVKPIDPTTGDATGAPIAVSRMVVGQMPMAFELTEANAMVAGTGFTGDVQITARVDADGEARTKQPGDIEGLVKTKIPADKLKLELNNVLK